MKLYMVEESNYDHDDGHDVLTVLGVFSTLEKAEEHADSVEVVSAFDGETISYEWVTYPSNGSGVIRRKSPVCSYKALRFLRPPAFYITEITLDEPIGNHD